MQCIRWRSNKRSVRNWFAKFCSGDTTLKDEPRAECPSDLDENLLKAILEQNPCQSTRDIAGRLNTSQSTICRYLEKLGKVSKLGVWVSHNLSERNKEDRMSIATSLLSRVKIEPFLDRIITSDEKWVTYDNIVRKRQWLDKDQPPLPDAKVNIHGKKILLCVWYCRGIHHEFLKSNLTITADTYVQQLQRVKEKLYEKRPTLAKTSFFYTTTLDHIQQGRLEKKFLNLDGQFYYTHLTPRTLPQQTITFSVLCKTFWMEKPSILKSKSVRLSKISSSPNQPHFTRKELISCRKMREGHT